MQTSDQLVSWTLSALTCNVTGGCPAKNLEHCQSFRQASMRSLSMHACRIEHKCNCSPSFKCPICIHMATSWMFSLTHSNCFCQMHSADINRLSEQQLALLMIACVTGDWAAFMQASTVQPEAPPAAVVSHDSGWDAFQSSEAAAPALAQSSASAPFDPFGESQAIEATSAGLKATGAGAAAPAVATAARSATKHAPQRSADDIMKMFDTPQQNTFAQFPGHGMNGLSQPQNGAFAMQQVSCDVCLWHVLHQSLCSMPQDSILVLTEAAAMTC